jgi:hypothetical protein
MTDAERCAHLTAEYNGVYCDYSRQRVTDETMTKLYELAEAADLKVGLCTLNQVYPCPITYSLSNP